MNISQCPLARDAIRQVVHTGIKFTQEEFLGGIYLYSKNVRVHPGPLYCFCPWLFPHVSVPAPNFQPSIRNSWPGYPWGWVSKSFHIVSLFLQCLFPALWLLPGWSLFVFSRYFTLGCFYVACSKIWAHYFLSRLTGPGNTFSTDRFDLYQNLFFILPSIPQLRTSIFQEIPAFLIFLLFQTRIKNTNNILWKWHLGKILWLPTKIPF